MDDNGVENTIVDVDTRLEDMTIVPVMNLSNRLSGSGRNAS
jgi:hypothetical protein